MVFKPSRLCKEGFLEFFICVSVYLSVCVCVCVSMYLSVCVYLILDRFGWQISLETKLSLEKKFRNWTELSFEETFETIAVECMLYYASVMCAVTLPYTLYL